jgi:hypothetical protein
VARPVEAGCKEPPRKGQADTAWVVDDRVFFCMRGELDQDGTRKTRACGSVSLSDQSRRVEPPTSRPPRGWRLPYAAAAQSRDGRYTFDLKGGERVPGGAVGTLTDTRTHVKKSSEILYDEHLAFEGWIGDGVVLRTWVEEGPGCTRWLYPVLQRWSFEAADRIELGGCYATAGDIFHAGPGWWAVITGGGGVLFVDEATYATTSVDTRRTAELDEGDEAIASAAPPLGLIVVYGTPYAGDVVQIDLEQRKVVKEMFIKTCP